ncbi:WhiB family transcriptional regulator [Streptomyces sp. NPDC047841]|uniref:WhiB family transcriptional regulator n=1 Tax=Streptomyces sp. NPDC047841 TaxID=3154708 RepID=UPI0034554826
MPRPRSHTLRLSPVGELWDWQRFAACRGMDSSIFYAPPGERGQRRRAREARARRICESCPVRQDCARMALETQDRYGVWGGLSEGDRNH